MRFVYYRQKILNLEFDLQK